MVKSNKKRVNLRKFLNIEDISKFKGNNKQKEIYYLGLTKFV